MAWLEQQHTSECVNQWFDILEKKWEDFPEFDEALKQELLDGARKSFTEAGMTLKQIQDTLDTWFPEDAKRNPFYPTEVEWVTILDVFEMYWDYYIWVDLEKAANSISSIYEWYEKRKWKYAEEYHQIQQDAHQWTIDCHLDVNREILQDYQRRIREYCKEQEIPLSVEKRLIESLELAKTSIYTWDYEFVRDNFEDVKSIMLTQINDIGKRWMWVYATKFTDEQLRYLHWVWVALVRASLDDIENT